MKPGAISAVVTGAGGGIGSEICRRLAARGARVLLIGRNATSLGRLAKALADVPAPNQSQGTAPRGVPVEDDRSRIDVLAVDLRLAEARLAVRDAASARHVNVLVNCAGIASFGPIESIDDSQLDDVIATNLTAPIALTRLLLPTLRAHSEASILNIGSVLGGIGMPGFTVYAASKAGLHAFSEALRRELTGSPVRVQFLGARATRTAFNSPRIEAFNRVTGAHSDPPQVVADAAVSLLLSGHQERYLGAAERLLVRLNAVAPGLLDSGFRRHRVALAQSLGTPAPSSSQHMPLP